MNRTVNPRRISTLSPEFQREIGIREERFAAGRDKTQQKGFI